MKKILAFLIAVSLSVLIAACGGGGGQTPKDKSTGKELTPFKIGYLASTGHVLYFIAQEKGYFAEEGLKSELVLFNNSGEGITAVASGKLDAGAFGSSAPLVFISKGSNITAFGGQMSQGHALVAKADKAAGFSSKDYLKGKTIATVRLATGDIVFREAAIQQGLKIGVDVVFREMESASAAMEAVKNGAADAAVVWTPFRKMAEAQGLKVVKYSSEVDGFVNHPCCRQIAATKALEKNPAKYEAFMRALIKAYRFYKNDQKGTIDILAKYVKIDKQTLHDETYGGFVESNPDPTGKAFAAFYGYMKDVNYIHKDFDVQKHINTSIYKNALTTLLKAEPDDAVFKKLEADFAKNN